MERNIVKIGDETLRKQSKPMQKFDLRLWLLLRDMAETMYKADGVGLAGAMIDRSGALVVTLTNGQLRELGQVVGKDGAPGRDGSDLTALSIDYDGARTLTVKGVAGEVKHCLPIPMDKGYWSDGRVCERHDIVTHDGIAWIALRDTREAPSVAAKEDWRIFARKGRDGKDGRNGIDKTAPVDLEPKPRKP